MAYQMKLLELRQEKKNEVALERIIDAIVVPLMEDRMEDQES